MDLSIAASRHSAVLKPDTITASQGDFLATHVPLKRIHVLSKFELQPKGGDSYSEEEIYTRFILNPSNKHQFITVYGQSGTGKSHLIRWLEARYENDRPENEVVLFIRRSDNTLKGTIRQLLEKPEVQGIANKAVYDRLVQATVFVAPEKLKDTIYHNLIIEISHDEDETRPVKLTNIKKTRLIAFLNNQVVHNHLLSSTGPIERLYSKIAENTQVDVDTIAQFVPDDFSVSADLYEEITNAGADPKAEKMALALMTDEGGIEEAKKVADYLNQFVNDVIQRCAGIEPGDFRQIFQDIRCELFRIGKNLTLFIEDVTSFTGVDDALLDALIVEHTGMNAGVDMCRISSIVGTTSNYLDKNFRDNHKDRITNLIYIPNNAFDENGLFEFVGRYLNAMSLPDSVINEWLENRALPEYYPVHVAKEGNDWDTVTIEGGKQLTLYPFTPNSIRYLYKHNVTQGHQTPRYIIRDVIEPVVDDILNGKATFPKDKYPLVGIDATLIYQIHNQIKDEAAADRLLRFLSIWGDGTSNRYSKDGITYLSGIKETILAEFGFPQITGSYVQNSSHVDEGNAGSEKTKEQDKPDDIIPPHIQKKFSEAHAMLTTWVSGSIIDVSANVGTVGTIRAALGDLNDFADSAINWLAEGLSSDNIKKVKSGAKPIIALENQLKGSGFYLMPNTWDSLNVLEAMIRWREYGKQSWKYPDSDFDAYIVSTWLSSVKAKIVSAVDENQSVQVSYVEAAMITELYRIILHGIYGEHSLKNLEVRHLLEEKSKSVSSSHHSSEWIKLAEYMAQKASANHETVQRYFNLPQGDGSSKLVLDEPRLSKAFHKVKVSKLVVPVEDAALSEPVKQRLDPYKHLKEVLERVGSVAAAELTKSHTLLELIQTMLEWDDEIDEDDVIDLVTDAKKFYQEINDSKINVQVYPTDEVKKRAKAIAKAYNDIAGIQGEKNTLNILMTFASDPIGVLQPLVDLLNRLKADIDKVDVVVEKRMQQFTGENGELMESISYANELAIISACIAVTGGVVDE